jgi:hypothetical protein
VDVLKRAVRFAVIAAMSACLGACGGGGGGDSSAGAGVSQGSDFNLSGTINGTPRAELSIKPGQTADITIATGDEINITSDVGVTWNATPGNATITAKAVLPQQWHTVVSSDVDQTVTLVASLGTKTATVRLAVVAQRYNAVARVVGDSLSEIATTTSLDGSTAAPQTTSSTVASVAPDGSYVLNITSGNTGSPVQTTWSASVNAAGTVQSETWTPQYSCQYSTSSDLLSFPLYVGKSWTVDQTWQCSTSNSAELDHYAYQVLGVETVTTKAGTFEALKIHSTVTVTKSPFANSAGNTADMTAWWAPSLGLVVKSTASYTYAGVVAGTNPKTIETELTTYASGK